VSIPPPSAAVSAYGRRASWDARSSALRLRSGRRERSRTTNMRAVPTVECTARHRRFGLARRLSESCRLAHVKPTERGCRARHCRASFDYAQDVVSLSNHVSESGRPRRPFDRLRVTPSPVEGRPAAGPARGGAPATGRRHAATLRQAQGHPKRSRGALDQASPNTRRPARDPLRAASYQLPAILSTITIVPFSSRDSAASG
jgi:hypothetical protein